MRIRIWTLVITAALSSAAFANQGVIDPGLKSVAAKSSTKQMLDVVVYLKHQPGYEISREVMSRYEPQIEQLSNQLRAIQVILRPSGSLTKAQEEDLGRRLQLRQVGQAEQALAIEIDALKNAMVNEISSRMYAECYRDHQLMEQAIRGIGGQMSGGIWVVNAVLARIPAGKVSSLAANDMVCNLFLNGKNGAELDTSVASVGAPAFWGAGFAGGAFDAGVLDVSAVQQALPGFAGKRFESNIGTTDSNGHPTNCAGIMCSVDATYRGVAHGLDSIASSMVNGTSVMMTNMNWMVTQTNEKPENINYSITDGTVNTVDYENVDKFFDGVLDTFALMVSKSAGNNGFGSGSPTITRPAPAYNLLACASLNDMANTNRADDRISSYSSRGPTPAGRKKPDIAAPGENITTLARTGGYTTGSGTSFAAPHVGGAVILLLHRGVVDTMTAKAILINTTDAMNDMDTSATTDDVFVQGSFWNRRYGWGYMNLNKALANATDSFTTTLPAPPNGGKSFKLYKGPMLNKDKATLVWNRHVGYNGAAFPTIIRNLSDLNLFCYNQADNSVMGSSTSTIDNVEQLHINANANVVLKVVTNGLFDPAVPTEKFALATEEGFSVCSGPSFQVTIIQPAEYPVSVVGGMVVRVKNVGDVPAFSVNLNWLTQSTSGPATINIGTLAPGQTVDRTFLINMPAAPGEYLAYASATSSSYGENWSTIGDGAVACGDIFRF